MSEYDRFPLSFGEVGDDGPHLARRRLDRLGPSTAKNPPFQTCSAETPASIVERHRVHPSGRRLHRSYSVPPLQRPAARFVERILSQVHIAKGQCERSAQTRVSTSIPLLKIHRVLCHHTL